ncbi:hypothetical protein AN639_07205 [Candidatus Epulonipiscium fishelsonii]|uniref:Uncharacterized protein n=1 Tax=Candidatus Epulonipiscium fishelsonii TaxID=77094 RepID=A0ACC8XA44_9FIRM|nr:hypothetical protein AN639_07205 [Epulopiscium sp. SCG-B05WGA-EpuloA1]ONI39038.1 hypothetical protein AN396_09185 [Epulopiscium sp. SCG-B11WGA-EpuloA1]
MKKAIYCDIDACTGCGACIVACMDENDIDLSIGETANRRVHGVEKMTEETMIPKFASVSCMHCEDSPCLIGCPTGAIYRHKVTSAVMVNRDLCIGCHSCALACPFGVPRYDNKNKLVKCDQCSDRVVANQLPACVRVCPIRALKYLDINEALENKSASYIGKILK